MKKYTFHIKAKKKYIMRLEINLTKDMQELHWGNLLRAIKETNLNEMCHDYDLKYLNL